VNELEVVADPAQEALIELVVMHGEKRPMQEILSELRVSPKRFASWLDNHAFRERLLRLLARREELHVGEGIAALRQRAMAGDDKDAHRYFKLYLDTMGSLFRPSAGVAGAGSATGLPPGPTATPDEAGLADDVDFDITA